MTKVVIAEVIKAMHGSNKIGFLLTKADLVATIDECPTWQVRDCCSVFYVALLLGTSVQPLGDKSNKYGPFSHGETVIISFQKKKNVQTGCAFAFLIHSASINTIIWGDLTKYLISQYNIPCDIASDQDTHFIKKEVWYWISDGELVTKIHGFY